MRRFSAGYVALVLAAGMTVGGCGQSASIELPDLSLKKKPADGAKEPLTAAEQKQAIDSLIAKRNALEKGEAR